MIVFRITTIKYADRIQASGVSARWNKAGQKVIYTSESRSLACLENIVHRSTERLGGLYKTLIIDVPDRMIINTIEEKSLPIGWNNIDQYHICQAIGAKWVSSGATAILKVPSALVPQEKNYILNALHPDFSSIRLMGVEEFTFDSRFTSL
jgi:RES domain-containing protein